MSQFDYLCDKLNFLKSKLIMKKAESTGVKVVRVGFTEDQHKMMEDYQACFKFVHGKKISKEQIVTEIFDGKIKDLPAAIKEMNKAIEKLKANI